VAQYFSAYGFKPQSEAVWHMLGPGKPKPKLTIFVRQHIKAAKHTWYIIESSLVMYNKIPIAAWTGLHRASWHICGSISTCL